MKKKIQKYLSGEREGFSLVELIIVIAIMAILIGVVALAVIPYLEKSRVGKDQQTVDTVYSAFQHTIADQKIKENIKVTINGTGASAEPANADFITAMTYAITGTESGDLKAATAGKLESKNAKAIICKFTATDGKIVVYATNGTDDAAVDGIQSSNQATS